MSLNTARVQINAELQKIEAQIKLLDTAKKDLRTSLKLLGRPGSEDKLTQQTLAIVNSVKNGPSSDRKSGKRATAGATLSKRSKSQAEKPATKAAQPAKAGRKQGAKSSGKVTAKVTMGKRTAANAATNGTSAPVSIVKGAGKLPKTGEQFMLSLVNSVPKSREEVLKAAVAKLGFKPSETEVNKIKRRIATAFDVLVKSGKIADQGAGRGRKFLSAAS